jgi:hypothetical protein
MAALSATLFGSISLGVAPAHAQCGGGGGYRGGGYYGKHTFGRNYCGYYTSGFGCGGVGGGCMVMSGMHLGGMSMGGMQMPTMQMPATQRVAASIPGMNMNGAAAPVAVPASVPTPSAPAAATAQYDCAMHPNVVASFPAEFPYCGMALTRK